MKFYHKSHSLKDGLSKCTAIMELLLAKDFPIQNIFFSNWMELSWYRTWGLIWQIYLSHLFIFVTLIFVMKYWGLIFEALTKVAETKTIFANWQKLETGKWIYWCQYDCLVKVCCCGIQSVDVGLTANTANTATADRCLEGVKMALDTVVPCIGIVIWYFSDPHLWTY